MNQNFNFCGHLWRHVVTLVAFVALLLVPGEAWGAYGLYSLNANITSDHPYFSWAFCKKADESGGKADYLDINFCKFNDAGEVTSWVSHNIQMDNVQSLCSSASTTEWKPVTYNGNTQVYEAYGVKYTAFYRRITYSGNENSLEIALVFDDYAKLKTQNKFYAQISTYDKYEGTNAETRYVDVVNNIQSTDANVDDASISWNVKPTLDVSVTDDSKIGQSMALVKTESDISVLRYRFDRTGDMLDLSCSNGISDSFTIPTGTSEVNFYTSKPLPTIDGMTVSSNPMSSLVCISLDVKKFLNIRLLTVTAKDGTDSDTGEPTRTNEIKWYVPSDPNNDIMSSDQFIVLRSTDEDFTDPATVGTVALTKYSGSNSNGYYYTMEDADAEAQYNKSGDKIYYRVVRAIVYAQWPSHRGKYCQTITYFPSVYIPSVSAITVTKKDANFDSNKTVKVKVKLESPAGNNSPITFSVENVSGGTMENLLNPETGSWVVGYGFNKTFAKNPCSVTYKSSKPIELTSYTLTTGDDNATNTGCTPKNWIIYGSNDGSTWTELATVTDDTKMQDKNRESYTYSVSSSDYYTYFKLEISAVNNDGRIMRLGGWTLDYKKLESGYCMFDDNANVSITRYSPTDEWYEGKDYADKTITISGSDVTYDKTNKCWYAEVEDVQNAPYTHYYYKATVDNSNGNYASFGGSVSSTEAEANACYSETIAQINSISSTRGTAKGRVVTEWNVGNGENTGYEVWRREYEKKGETAKDWAELSLDDQKATAYTDMKAYPGHAYEYKVRGYLDCRGKRYYTKEVTSAGYSCYYGNTSGKLLMKDGSGVPYATRVSISLNHVDNDGDYKDLVIPTIYDRNKADSIIMPGISTIAKNDTILNIYTKEDGSFELDSIPFIASDKELTKYDITVHMNDVTNPTGNYGAYPLTFTDNTYEHLNLKFVASKVHVFQGRVLYANSTVPSRGIQFYVSKNIDGSDKTLLLDSKGEPVVTDNDGNYKFAVPDDATMYIQAYKKGHTLYNDGVFDYDKLIGNTSADKNGTVFNIADSTTVRLVGRIVGGDIQGDKPIGFGQTTNNLGDNLRLVMMLEGDNTSYITYREEDPDNTTRTESFKQELTNDKDGKKSEVDSTYVSFERKRIVITPDVKTGEFVLDLPPTKYKITELSATGYSTFFTEGEGFAVLDLTNDSVAGTYTDSISPTVKYTTQYHHTYNRVYHAPVKVTYQQYMNGIAQDFFGSGNIKSKTIYGKDITAQSYQNGKYLFGYPVFQNNVSYEMHVRAHEDYYYNNDENTLPEEVPLKGAKLHIDNGFLSSNCNKTIEMDSLGAAKFYVLANNASFSLTGDKALRELNMQAEQNGYYYDAEPLQAYVTGTRSTDSGTVGTDITTRTQNLNSEIQLLDIVRDPYTAKGYAWRDRGTKYTWSRNQTLDISVNASIGMSAGSSLEMPVGTFVGALVGGAYIGSNMEVEAEVSAEIELPTIGEFSYNRKANYAVTLNEKVQTSSSPYDVGANADVYIGVVNTAQLKHEEAFNILDEESYTGSSNAFKTGRMKLVAEGADAEGKKFYLVTGEQLTICDTVPSTFVYNQRHIMTNVIPGLLKELDQVVINGDKESIQALANANNKVYYRVTNQDYNILWPADSVWYEEIRPTGNKELIVDQAGLIINTIKQWLKLVQMNEEHKIAAREKGTLLKRYSIAGSTVDYSQSASSQRETKYTGVFMGYDFVNENTLLDMGIKIDAGSGAKGKGESEKKETKPSGDANATTSAGAKLPGFSFSFSFSPSASLTYENEYEANEVYTAGSGFHMGLDDDEYADVEVYKEAQVTNNTTNSAEQEWYWSEEDWQWLSKDTKETQEIGENHDYVFYLKGGASHSPWMDADSTLCYQLSRDDNGTLHGVPLSVKTLKMDVPKIYIANNTVSNLPKNERAVFSLTLANESEYKGSANSASFTLKCDPNSNPYGAQMYIDGAPLGNGLTFSLAPGKSVVKTLEVARGTLAYDYENLGLVFSDSYGTLKDKQVINVHYLPEATALKITSPTDKWVMNTLSAQDEDKKYYLPVNITGFDVNSENFDHIEFQYKKQTEGDASWVNLCSYYAKDDEYYQKATGTKKLLTSGSISDQRFYGEKDPMEMKYDLRAVSFNRLGNGYVTYASNVMSGTKDTRCPEVFGSPSPKGGVLGVDDVISLKFSEDIAYNYLDETANFQVTGYTNSTEKQQQTYYIFPANAGTAKTTLTESFKERSFTFDMMAYFPNYTGEKNSKAELISVVDPTDAKSNLILTVEDNALVLYSDSIKIAESAAQEDLQHLGKKKVHVGVAYYNNTKEVYFIVGDNYVADINTSEDKTINVNGNICFAPKTVGGTVYNLRLWDRYMDETAYPYKEQTITGTERYLLCYWPMSEGTGTVAKEKVYGMNMNLSGGDWHISDGYALHLNKRTLSLKNADRIMRTSQQDFSIGLWVKRIAKTVNAGGNEVDTTQILRLGATNNPIRIVYASNDRDHIALVTKAYNKKMLDASADEGLSQWHHVMLTVDRKNDIAATYVDGKQADSFAATQIPTIESTDFVLGDDNGSMSIDAIEFWQLALPSYYIADGYNSKRSGTEMGLAIYLPLDSLQKEPEGYFTHLNLHNQAQKDKELREMFAEDVPVVSALTTSKKAAMEATLDQCPRKADQELQVLPITWSSTGTELQVNVDRTDKDLNGQTINITVRGVEDLAGNPMANPKMWSVYVNRNALKWYEKSFDIAADYGKTATLTAKWQNVTGRNLRYTMDNTATWLTISQRSGTAEPLDIQSVDFEVSDGLAPGTYSTVVYLTDQDGLSSPLKLNVTVTAQEPDWTVVSDQTYNQTMNIIGVVKQKDSNGRWIVENDKRDVVAAFIDNVCVGKANITADAENGMARLYMTVRGNTSCNRKKIKFYMWDASTDKRQHLVIYDEKTDTSKDTVFIKNTILGIDEPLDMRTSSDMFQYIDLAQGWNWVSFNVKHTTTGISSFFNNTEFTNEDIITIPGSSTFYSYNSNTKSWGASNVKLDQSNICQIYVHNAMTAKVCGEDFNDNTRYVIVNVPKANGWAPLAYLLNVSQPLKQALTDFKIGEGEKCLPGTVIKSFNQFAVATSDGKWMGSLTYMKPGEGYFLRSAEPMDSVKIIYTNNTVSEARAMAETLETSETSETLSLSTREHNNSMPVIANFADGSAMVGDVLVAYANGEVVGAAEFDAEAGLFFISVNAENGSNIKFAKVRGGRVEAVASRTLGYKPNDVIGTLEKPYLVDFDATGINGLSADDENTEVYDLMGRRYRNYKDSRRDKGVYIMNGNKVVR